MTGNSQGLVSPLFDPEAQQRVAVEQKRRQHEAVELVYECFLQVWNKLDGDMAEMAGLFGAFAKAARSMVPRKRKGRHDPDFDKALLAAYDAAPKGQKTARAGAVGEDHGKEPETTERHLRRLLRERKQQAPPIDKIVAAFRRGGPESARSVLMEWFEARQREGWDHYRPL
jgi:hypothetical protein